MTRKIHQNSSTGERDPESSILTHLKNAGSNHMAVNGSVTPVDFTYVVPVGKIAVISRLLIHIVDGNPVTVDTFGALSALTNGVEIGFYDDQDVLQLDPMGGGAIKANYDWSELSGIDAEIKAGTSKSAFISRWSLFKTGAPMRLTEGRYIQFKIQDNLSSIEVFRTAIQGQLYNVGP